MHFQQVLFFLSDYNLQQFSHDFDETEPTSDRVDSVEYKAAFSSGSDTDVMDERDCIPHSDADGADG